jgi:hypothetical protein
MASYDFDYAIHLLRQAIDFAEIEHDFAPLRKMVNEAEASGHELDAMNGRLNFPAGQEVLAAILQSVATGSVTSEAALLRICHWLNNGQAQETEAEFTQQYQFA